MESTLESGDRILVSTLFYRPSCGDIVIIDAQEAVLLQEDGTPYAEEGLDKSIVKRIIAVGGQTIDIDPETGAVLVDGVVQEEPYISADTFIPSGGGAFTYPVEIPDGYVFVMGDNREVSKDSRYADVGLVAVSEIDGEVLFRLSPWESIGFVN
jgi:signal peptidase I